MMSSRTNEQAFESLIEKRLKETLIYISTPN